MDVKDIIPKIQDVELKSLCQANEVKFLPCTPEIGLIEMIEKSSYHDFINSYLKDICRGQSINIKNIINSQKYKELNKSNPRALAKDKVEYIIKAVKAKTGKNISIALYEIYCKTRYDSNLGELKGVFGQIFK